MTVLDALKNALTFLEANGYTDGGDIHDDLALAIAQISRLPIARKEL